MPDCFERTISEIRAQIHRARMSRLEVDRQSFDDVDCVRSRLIEPILAALRWQLEDPAEVRTDLRIDGLAEGFSYALFRSGTPYVLILVYGMEREIGDLEIGIEALRLVSEAGFDWVLLTDGDCFDVYRVQLNAPPQECRFGSVRISDKPAPELLSFFAMLERRDDEENRLESAWRRSFADRHVLEILERLLRPETDLVHLIADQSGDLSADEVRESLGRVRLSLEIDSLGGSEASARLPDQLESTRSREMSAAELRVATWLQRRSIERWARRDSRASKSRTSQRRSDHDRRMDSDRRLGGRDRRRTCVESAEERRIHGERRVADRRMGRERRVLSDRRRTRRRD